MNNNNNANNGNYNRRNKPRNYNNRPNNFNNRNQSNQPNQKPFIPIPERQEYKQNIEAFSFYLYGIVKACKQSFIHDIIPQIPIEDCDPKNIEQTLQFRPTASYGEQICFNYYIIFTRPKVQEPTSFLDYKFNIYLTHDKCKNNH